VSEGCDAIVVGMGPGGEEVAGRLAEAGLDVVGVERRLVGGECPYWGCIPSKMMIRAANLLAEARRIPGFAGTAMVSPDWSFVAARIREATDAWDDRVAVERFEKKGGRFVRGSGRLDGVGRVQVGDRVFEASRAVVLNPGTAPAIPPIPGLDQVDYWTNREVIELEELPRSLVVLGGGAVGLELAQVLNRFGVRVAIVEAAPRLLALEEPEAGTVLNEVLVREGVEVHTGCKARAIRQEGEDIVVEVDDGKPISGRRLLVATGRRAHLAELGLDSVGIDTSQPNIPVDENLRAGERLWAIGDATGKGAFTHISMYQARIAAADILGQDHRPADYHALPRVTFTDPEVGGVGLTEAQARERGLTLRTGVGNGQTSARGWIHGPGNEGFIKLVEDQVRGVLVGATAAGPMGGEVMSMLAVAVQQAVPVEDLRHMIYAYPTFHRGMEDALTALS
jgi:pyruvate/2-oxoglutarate dehydrogenase complex dihydrolipoamide dehydrogenase (E3) component